MPPPIAAAAATAATPTTPSESPPRADHSRRLGDRHLLDSDALENIDRMTNVALGQLSGGISPASLAMAYLGAYALSSAVTGNAEDCIKPLPGDHRFDHPGWQRFPYNVVYQGFLLNQQWWHNATTGIRGVSKHGEAAVWFTAKQILDMTAPCNVPFMNPEIVEATARNAAPIWRAGPSSMARTSAAPSRREASRHRGLPGRGKPRRHTWQGRLS
jgi:polyhydroxyalkanoate synthase